jgi:uncharacterized protein with PIN domain
MLGTVARKLRILGFDTAYLADTSDDEVLKLGIEQKRIIITADREFFKRIVAADGQGVLVSGTSELEDIGHIFSKLGIKSVQDKAIGSRCTACNAPLEKKSSNQVRDKVPLAVMESQTEFNECPKCGKVYWNGSHMLRIRVFVKKLEAQLAKNLEQ